MISQWELVIRILVAASAGLALGLEREWGGHPAGARTHLLVAVGACLFTLSGGYGLDPVHTAGTDPTRVAAQVVSGIGFLGAGAIIQSGASIRGLTTAATVWISGALGVAAGAGVYLLLAAGLATVLAALVGLSATRRLLRRRRPGSLEVDLLYEQGSVALGPLVRGVTELKGRIDELVVEADPDPPGLRRVLLRVRVRDRTALQALMSSIHERPEVHAVSVR
ncbi:MgtC/SapB family protein [Streptomyces sp. NPDC093591]|uniref:MgtC/SapB family protein n=1 Tax=Streptomyces sp. NPDC093591 TaxID=3366044 RepID=UPI00382E21BF